MTRAEIIAALAEPHDSAEHVRLMGMLDETDKEVWVPLAKALFEVERDPAIKDQAWFDFQSKAQRLLAIVQQQQS